MKTYSQFLKLLVAIIGIGIVVATVVSLAIVGLGMDLSNAFTDSSGSMYFLFLPLGFLVGVIYFFTRLGKRQERRQYARYRSSARSEFAKNYNLGDDIPTMIIRALEEKGAMSIADIAHRLSLDDSIVREHMRTMLLTQQVTQQVKEGIAFYDVTRGGQTL